MCGIFGMVRNQSALHPEKASAVLIELGKKSVSRGRDSAGVAFVPPADLANPVARDATIHQTRSNVSDLDGVLIVKAKGTFHSMWNDAEYTMPLMKSAVAIGHTRASTQGNTSDLANASPLAVGQIVGTHNGDVDKSSVPMPKGHIATGSTDTEYMYRGIDAVNSHRKKITDILTKARGRVAAVWIDRSRPDRLYMARAGLSPLAVGYDAEGNMYWASNPGWFREIDAEFDNTIGFHSIHMVAEGSLLTVNFGSGEAVFEDLRSFVPTVRSSDESLGFVVWRDFNSEDRKADEDTLTHLTAARTSKYSSYSPSKGATTGYSSPAQGAVGSSFYSDTEKASAQMVKFSNADAGANDPWAGTVPESWENDNVYDWNPDNSESGDPFLDELVPKGFADDLLTFNVDTDGGNALAYEEAERAVDDLEEVHQGDIPRQVLDTMREAAECQSYDGIIRDFGLSSKAAAVFLIAMIGYGADEALVDYLLDERVG